MGKDRAVNRNRGIMVELPREVNRSEDERLAKAIRDTVRSTGYQLWVAGTGPFPAPPVSTESSVWHGLVGRRTTRKAE